MKKKRKKKEKQKKNKNEEEVEKKLVDNYFEYNGSDRVHEYEMTVICESACIKRSRQLWIE